jgi:hypothetical protein
MDFGFGELLFFSREIRISWGEARPKLTLRAWRAEIEEGF